MTSPGTRTQAPAAASLAISDVVIDLVTAWTGAPGPDELRAGVEWRRPLEGHFMGRTCWIPVGTGALKVKGAGLAAAGTVTPPSAARSFYRTFLHIGFGPAGDWRTLDSGPAPLGGLTLSRARAEYDAADRLRTACVPSVLPVAVWRYDDLAFRPTGEPMGVVATLAPEPAHWRGDLLLRPPAATDPAARAFLDALTAGGSRAEALVRLARSYGRAVRGMNEAGLYRHSGGPTNWGWHRGRDEVYLIDLDSCRPLADRPAPVRALECLRDLASGIFNTAAHMMGARATFRLPECDLRAGEPFRSLAAGYFHDVPTFDPNQMIGPFSGYFAAVYRRHLAGEWPMWLDRRLGYAAIFLAAEPAYAAAARSGRLPPLPAGGVEEEARRFLGPAGCRRLDALGPPAYRAPDRTA